MKRITLFFAILLAGFITAGCTVKVWDKQVLEVSGEKDKDGKPVPMFGTVITVHQYGYATQPQPAPPGTPPSPPEIQPSGVAVIPPPVSYKTVYASKWDDPTLVVIQNQSPRFVRLKIDGEKGEIRLAPYQATADLYLAVGEHRVRVVTERPTEKFGVLEVAQFIHLVIRPDGRSQSPIYFYSYWW
ncbi:MAG: hypothetical protein AAB536_02130 [Patescibacteria group bacterium]